MSRTPRPSFAHALLPALFPAMLACAAMPVSAQSSGEEGGDASSNSAAGNQSTQQDSSQAKDAAKPGAKGDPSPNRDVTSTPRENDTNSEPGPVSATLRAQVLLERAHFSPGVIDGQMGGNTRRALSAYQAANGLTVSGDMDDATLQALGGAGAQVLTRVTLTDSHVAGPFADTPDGTEAMAKADALPYESVEEKLAETFHVTPGWLRKHNPGVELTAGTTLIVPMLEGATELPKPARIVVDESDRSLMLEDASGKVIAHFPVTTGSAEFPLPIGEWTVTGVATDPVWYFDPALISGTAPDAQKAEIPPGPNNPVGVVWIDLSKEHYGIHGTPDPSRIGKTASNGCVRMTNWSALALSKVVSTGMTVSMRR